MTERDELVIYAVIQSDGFIAGAWKELATAEHVLSKGRDGDRIVKLVPALSAPSSERAGMVEREELLKRLQEQIDSLSCSLRFYRDRVNLLSKWQSKMRDPERTIVCDIIANGQTLPDPNGERYGLPAQPSGVREGMLRAARICMKRAEDRFAELGITEPDTNASYYPKNKEYLAELDEEAAACSEAILRAAESQPQGVVVPDKGPWEASADGKHIQSDDFNYDVRLYVNGDFGDDATRKKYSDGIASILTKAAQVAK